MGTHFIKVLLAQDSQLRFTYKHVHFSFACIIRAGWSFSQRVVSTLRSPQTVPSIPAKLAYRGFASLQSSSTQNIGITSLVKNMDRLSLQPTTPLLEQVRTKVRYSKMKGKPKSVHSVPARFFRLNWGIWIRTRAGRAKRLWTKSSARKYRLRQHVFCNRQQSKLLDKMVTDFWKRPKYWVDDPYAPYHKRENFDTYFPQKRPFYP